METILQPINVFLVDDHGMFREGLARILEKQPDLRVVGQAPSAAQALSLLLASGATMILLDVDLGPERALDFVNGARRLKFDGKILVLTAGLSGSPETNILTDTQPYGDLLGGLETSIQPDTQLTLGMARRRFVASETKRSSADGDSNRRGGVRKATTFKR